MLIIKQLTEEQREIYEENVRRERKSLTHFLIISIAGFIGILYFLIMHLLTNCFDTWYFWTLFGFASMLPLTSLHIIIRMRINKEEYKATIIVQKSLKLSDFKTMGEELSAIKEYLGD